MIKELERIPASDEKPTQRNMVRTDINEAISKNISTFELLGDYNYNSLPQTVRAVLEMAKRRMVFRASQSESNSLGVTEITEKLKIRKKYEKLFPIKYYQVKMKDRVHTYVTINYEDLSLFGKVEL